MYKYIIYIIKWIPVRHWYMVVDPKYIGGLGDVLQGLIGVALCMIVSPIFWGVKDHILLGNSQSYYFIVAVLIVLIIIFSVIFRSLGLSLERRKDTVKVSLRFHVIQVFISIWFIWIIVGVKITEELYITVLSIVTIVCFLIIAMIGVQVDIKSKIDLKIEKFFKKYNLNRNDLVLRHVVGQLFQVGKTSKEIAVLLKLKVKK